LTLAWLLRDFHVRALAPAAGVDAAASGELDMFRVELIGRLLDLGKPE
jgi:hypothetical protein